MRFGNLSCIWRRLGLMPAATSLANPAYARFFARAEILLCPPLLVQWFPLHSSGHLENSSETQGGYQENSPETQGEFGGYDMVLPLASCAESTFTSIHTVPLSPNRYICSSPGFPPRPLHTVTVVRVDGVTVARQCVHLTPSTRTTGNVGQLCS